MTYPLRWGIKTLCQYAATAPSSLSLWLRSADHSNRKHWRQRTLQQLKSKPLAPKMCCCPASHENNLTMGQSQAVTVSNRNVHNSGGGHLFDEFGSERRGLRGTAAKAGTTAPCINLKTTVICIRRHLHVNQKKLQVGEVEAASGPVLLRSRRGTTGSQHTLS